MDIARGTARSAVVSTRGTGASKLHQRSVARSKSMDMRAPSKQTAPRPVGISPAPKPEPSSRPTVSNVDRTTAPVTPTPARRPHDPARVAERLTRAQAVRLHPNVTRFGNEPRITPADRIPAPAPEPIRAIASITTIIPPSAITAHQALTLLPVTDHDAGTPAVPVKWGHYATIAGVVAVMSGYIWLQNYSKLTIQTAAAKAGVVATAPSYLPTSYSLATANSTPGLLTLNFKSPSQSSALTIAQQRTTWDAKSLLDNYVAKADPGYNSVNGQGLTIYVYGQNQAAWINHGIWYSITGATRLSREQILKIAYGL
jgi:hypothetical protein